ncbi:hypothetical protein N7509_006398 [Penicillium cosmopolitanum]|uniref:tRNA (adenine(58)-N(1))-methyltransferase non-catalytic subunit TRM6 n=1 Tax=Penicillium cosmopolitanum TaxID=1131564 RepID=A0A9W9W441_9EURO|nr:uncharacterized protein N7509_006398 [Penicillium cosmopolitanum]KAJ5398285.1 hypothetical protein N7509_006398 [Penicillium cosmopolitanum]
MHSFIPPNQFVAIKLPSDQTRIVKLVPDSLVQLGKYGSFPANQIIGRPFYFTFEIQDTAEKDGYKLRVVSATELHAETLIEEAEADGEGEDQPEGSEIPMRTNRQIVDDASTQTLTLQEIEELKKEAGGAGKEIIAKILESHTALDQKTAFSLAKYTLRKRQKYLKRFTVVPLDVSTLANFMLAEKDATRTMELRDEHIGLLGCFGNVHYGGDSHNEESTTDGLPTTKPNGRYYVVDETGGLVVAAMAERMGILYPRDEEEDEDDGEEEEATDSNEQNPTGEDSNAEAQGATSTSKRKRPQAMSASGNTITVVHASSQPNLSLLKYFGYDINTPDENHPLHTHLKTVTWLQMLDPAVDPILSNRPAEIPPAELAALKGSKRSAYHFKRNRWERIKKVVEEARAGSFDGLVVATLLEPASVLKNLVPLLSGSASVAVYSPTVESLVVLMDKYSTTRRTAFINNKRDLEAQSTSGQTDIDLSSLYEEFELDPTLLLPPTLHRSRVRAWQVLPGRTHPLMTGRGGAEGYLFHGVRVIPTTANVQAAGTFRKKRKLEQQTSTPTPTTDQDVEMAS